MAQLNLDPPKVISASDTWSDYDGDTLYGDYTWDGQSSSEHMAFGGRKGVRKSFWLS